ncbi:MAG: hypothetical protein ACOCVG_00190, partial [Verrucomicrobiota bacterium]
MRILIVEEALQRGNGHWPGYIGGIVAALRASGDDVDVLMHREAAPELVESLGGTPWLSRNCWEDAASQGGLGGLRHNLGMEKELKVWLREQEPYDWVFALTMRLQHLLAFGCLSRWRGLPQSTRFLLLFVQGFGRYQGRGQPLAFPRNPSTLLARFCFRMLAPG